MRRAADNGTARFVLAVCSALHCTAAFLTSACFYSRHSADDRLCRYFKYLLANSFVIENLGFLGYAVGVTNMTLPRAHLEV